jgi:2-C-methyl-D-erythritol 4-phosphate cytidylyltransferase
MQETSAAIIVAAGTSRRMQGVDKLWIPLAGRITLARTIDVFQSSPLIDTIILVTSSERIEQALRLCNEEGWHKVAAVVAGGARRQDSVGIGLNALAARKPDTHWVTIHDAARPLVTPALLELGLETACKYQAAIAAVPVKDTIKEVRDGKIESTPDRSQLWTVQTPQVFSFPLLYEAHQSVIAQQDMTDDATLLERLGYPVTIFSGSYANIKITTQEDILLAEALLRGKTL